MLRIFPSNTEKWSSCYEYAGSSSEEDLAEKVSARGRSLSSPKTKPGISPTIFTDFLLDCAVFLDLSDMSSYLPDLKEMVVTVPMAREVARDHSILVSRLTAYAKRRESGGFALLSQALQYGLFIRTCRMATKRSVIRLMETF